MKDRVNVINRSNHIVGLTVPDLRLKKTWNKKGVRRSIKTEDLRDAFFEPGVEYLFKSGILDIDDMELKIELGLEDEDAKKPVKTRVLSDEEKRKFLTTMPVDQFTREIEEISHEQLEGLCDFAIENQISTYNKDRLLLEKVGVDISKAIELKAAAES